MRHEQDQLEYEDALVDFNSACERYGFRQVLLDYRDAFPAQFQELYIQIQRIPPHGQIAALLR